jgi:hypothetical protein
VDIFNACLKLETFKAAFPGRALNGFPDLFLHQRNDGLGNGT